MNIDQTPNNCQVAMQKLKNFNYIFKEFEGIKKLIFKMNKICKISNHIGVMRKHITAHN